MANVHGPSRSFDTGLYVYTTNLDPSTENPTKSGLSIRGFTRFHLPFGIEARGLIEEVPHIDVSRVPVRNEISDRPSNREDTFSVGGTYSHRMCRVRGFSNLEGSNTYILHWYSSRVPLALRSKYALSVRMSNMMAPLLWPTSKKLSNGSHRRHATSSSHSKVLTTVPNSISHKPGLSRMKQL